MSAHEWIKNARRAIAHWFYEPFATTAWQPTPPLALPAPKEEPIQITGEIRLPNILEGIAGERVLHYPTGTWMQMNGQHREPHRRRDTGKIGQCTGPMSPIPATPRDTDGIRQLPARTENRDWADLDTARKLRMQQALDALDQQRREAPKLPRVDLAGDALHPQQSRSRFADVPTAMNLDGQMSRVIAQVDRGRQSQKLSWLYEEIPPTPPVLAPLGAGDLAVSDRIAQPGGNIAEVRVWEERSDLFADVRQASRPLVDDDPTVESPRVRFQRIIDQLRESEV